MERALKVEIALVPVGCGDRDTHWQGECRQLVANMRTDLQEYGADVKPQVGLTATGTRGRTELSYSTFSLVAQSDALVAALPLAWDVLKRWVEPRAGEVGSVRGSSSTDRNTRSPISPKESGCHSCSSGVCLEDGVSRGPS